MPCVQRPRGQGRAVVGEAAVQEHVLRASSPSTEHELTAELERAPEVHERVHEEGRVEHHLHASAHGRGEVFAHFLFAELITWCQFL